MLLAPVGAGAAPSQDAVRAVASYAAMERSLFDRSTHRYVEAYAWPVSQAVAATIAVARIPGARTEAAAFAVRGFEQLGSLRDGALYRANAGGSVYYDDNEWIAEDLLDWNLYRRNPPAVARAEGIFAGVVHAWDGDGSTPCSGGVYWTTESGVGDRNTVSTANGALVGLRLYALTHRPVFLYWSRRMLGWLDTCMLAPDGLYWDHVGPDGTVDRRVWTYNQGSLVGAYLTLYETTGDMSALARAEQVADATLADFAGDRLAAEPPEFAAIFFRRALDLASVDGRSSYVTAAQSYADQAWSGARDPTTGLFSSRLLGQAAFVQLYAQLALMGNEAAVSPSPPRAAAPTGRG
jgi:Glycosyl hydrolase family 76